MDEHAQTVGNFLDDRHAESRRRIAALEAELAAERERREAAEKLLRGMCCPHPANRAPDDTTVDECIRRDECGCVYGGHFTRYKD